MLDARTNLHPFQTYSNDIVSRFEIDVLENGLPDPKGYVSGYLQVGIESLKSNNALYDQTMKDVLDTRRFPHIRAEITNLRSGDGEGNYVATGEIEFRGITRAMTSGLRVRRLDQRTLRIMGEIVVDVRKFDIYPPRVAMLRVYPDISVKLTLFAERVD